MLLKWLRQTKKTVFFRRNELDETLLEAVKTELARQPGLSFSSLCKEALHERLLGQQPYPHQPPSSAPSSIDRRVESLEAQLLSVEQRFFAQEKKRLERLETQLQQLSIQMAQLGGTVPAALSAPPTTPEVMLYEKEAEEPAIDDPVLSRLSGLIDDF